MVAAVHHGPPWAPALEARACSEFGVMASQELHVPSALRIVALLLAGGAASFVLNFAEFSFIGLSSALTMGVASVVKVVLMAIVTTEVRP